MVHPKVNDVVEAIFDTIHPGILPDQAIHSLTTIFSSSLVAALDLIDRGCVVRYTTPWARTFFQVMGSTDRYSVYPHLDTHPRSSKEPEFRTPPYCSCPAFAYAVLLSDSHVMCKHVLAVRLAERLEKVIDRKLTEEDLAAPFSEALHRTAGIDVDADVGDDEMRARSRQSSNSEMPRDAGERGALEEIRMEFTLQ